MGTTAKMDADAAIKKANDLRDAADAAARSRMVYIGAGVAQALSDVALLQRSIDNLKGRQVYIGAGRTGPATLANGGILANAMGSITAYAGGGENHVAQIAPAGAMRLWAEPETGGEAYIPLAPAKRARSTAIWEETGKRLGVGGGQSSGPAFNVERMTVVGYNPDDAVAKFGAEISWTMAGTG